MTGTPHSCPSCGAALHESTMAQGLCVSCLLGSAAAALADVEGLQAGVRLGPYEIGKPLGKGGMGEVYEAWDTRLQRRVAIKVLPAGLSTDPQLTARLEREARIVASLNHPHICAVHDIGHLDEVVYVVMELVDGETLADRLTHGPLPLAEVLQRAIEIADGLDKAHSQGITHRDLKPANIMLTRAGVKLLDFGLAALRPGDERSTGDTHASGRRTPGAALAGTVPYMAPEQLDGEPADHRSDIFAFGLVLYEMLTGRPAFSGTSPARQILAVLSAEPIAPSAIRTDTPATLDRLVGRCLRKHPDDRWQSMRDLLFELQSLRDHPRPRFERARVTAWRSPGVLAAAAVLAVAGTLMAFVPFAGRPARTSPPGVIRFSPTRPPTPQALASTAMAFVSPDGSTLAWNLAVNDGRTLLAVRRFDSNESIQIAGTDGARWPFWSPDSRTIAFFDHGQLKRVSASGGPVEVIARAAYGLGGTWGRDGTIIFSPDRRGPLFRVPATGGDPTAITALDQSRDELSHEWPALLPDGKRFVYFASSNKPENRGLFLGELGSSERRWLGTSDGGAVYAAPGYLLFTRASMLLAQRLDPVQARLTGEPTLLAPRTYASTTLGPPSFSASENGVLVYHVASLFRNQLVWFNRSGQEIDRPLEAGSYFSPVLSPDDRHVAVFQHDADTMQVATWQFDLERQVFSRLTREPPMSTNAIWSPDGNDIIFAANQANSHAIYTIGAHGGPPRLLATIPTAIAPTDWSRDGTRVLYQTNDEDTGDDVWLLPLEAGASPQPVLRSPFNEHQARFSPNGRWIAYTSDESGDPEVFVQAFGGPAGRWQISSGGGREPMWRRDGRELFYLSADRRLIAVAVDTSGSFRAAAGTALFRLPIETAPESRASYAVTADGQRFLFNLVAPDQARPPVFQAQVVLNWLSTMHRQGGDP